MRNTILMSALLAMAGCSLNSPEDLSMWHYRNNPAKSMAMNVAMATGLADGKSGTLNDGFRDPKSMDSMDGNITYGQITPALTPSGTDASLDMETGLLGDSSLTDTQSTPHIYAFLPKQLAGNGYAAARLLHSMVTQAMAKALANQGFQMKSDAPGDDGSFIVTGGQCGKNGVHCTGDAAFSYLPSNILNGSRWDGGVLVDKGPDFTGGGPAWFFRGSAGIGALRDAAHRQTGEMDNGEVKPADIGLDMHRLYSDTTRYLPSWVYAYDPDDGGQPAIYTQGKTLRFTSPKLHNWAMRGRQQRS